MGPTLNVLNARLKPIRSVLDFGGIVNGVTASRCHGGSLLRFIASGLGVAANPAEQPRSRNHRSCCNSDTGKYCMQSPFVFFGDNPSFVGAGRTSEPRDLSTAFEPLKMVQRWDLPVPCISRQSGFASSSIREA